MLALLATVVEAEQNEGQDSVNGASDEGAGGPGSVAAPHKADHEGNNAQAKNGSIKPKRGELKATVRNAALRKQGPFDGYTLTKEIEESGFRFAASRPTISVLDVLRGMVAAGELRLAREGVGSESNLYEVVTGSV
jgi:hypothetical protein